MKWMAVTVETTSEGGDIIAQALMDCGSYGASIRDRAEIDSLQRPQGYWDMIDPSVYEGLGEGALVTGYFRMDASLGENLALLKDKLSSLEKMDLCGIELGSLAVTSDELEQQDWENCWRKFYKPTRVGERLVIKPTWETYEPQPGDLIVHMDPGMAFGTGTHETTSMCMELAEKYVKKDGDVIDVGCGTAILSIASVLLGARHARAVDIDLLAVDCARENIALNGMEDKIVAVQGDLLSGTQEGCDVMFANIVAGVIIGMAKDVPARLNRGGHLICSGIIREREEETMAALREAGLAHVQTLRKGEWVALCFQHA